MQWELISMVYNLSFAGGKLVIYMFFSAAKGVIFCDTSFVFKLSNITPVW